MEFRINLSLVIKGLFLFLALFFFVYDCKSCYETHSVFAGLMACVWGYVLYTYAKSFLAMLNAPPPPQE